MGALRKGVVSNRLVARCLLGMWIFAAIVHATVADADDIHEIVANTNDRIERHRKRDARVVFALSDGMAIPPSSTVRIQLQQHAFLFGGMLGSLGNANNATEEATYRKRFSDVMNYATLLFIWDTYEPRMNRPDFRQRQEVVRWCRSRGIATSGHSLMWNMEPKWLSTLPPEQSEQKMWDRIPEEVNRFRGQIDRWLVVNESTEGFYHARAKSAHTLLRAYEEYGIPKTVSRAYSLARSANPDASLILNDYEVTEKFEKNIQRCLDAGTDFDVIGLQAHMHQGYWGAEKIWDVCNRFAKFGKPLHFTELTVLSGRLMDKNENDWSSRRDDWQTTPRRERTQARQVSELYHLLFSHPAVEAITWWDLSDRYAWMAAPAGLLRVDFTPKPAYDVVRDLVRKKWTTNVTGSLDSQGSIRMRGFFGSYEAQVTVGSRVYTGRFSLEKNGPINIDVMVR